MVFANMVVGGTVLLNVFINFLSGFLGKTIETCPEIEIKNLKYLYNDVVCN